MVGDQSVCRRCLSVRGLWNQSKVVRHIVSDGSVRDTRHDQSQAADRSNVMVMMMLMMMVMMAVMMTVVVVTLTVIRGSLKVDTQISQSGYADLSKWRR